jgi:hypothetical protein
MSIGVKLLTITVASYGLILLLPSRECAGGPTVNARQAALQAALDRGEATWRLVAKDELRPTLSSRWLAGYALTLCEAKEHPERVERLLALARRMQDQDSKSKLWGNLRWYWRDERVTDPNAVEFVMHDALVVYIRHRDWLPDKARSELDELLRLGVEGCRRHRVPSDYTNIALLNAGNLIVLGERLHRADAAEEGYRRLDGVCALTGTLGVHEFCSPTYYGTDLNGLMMIQSYARNERQRKQADALLRLFWTDIAANWFQPGGRLGGCHSRSYDFLRGIGALDWHLWTNGWLELQSPGSAERCEPWSDQWQPPPELAEMARRQVPRLVRQHWGFLPAESRTQMIYPDVALSCCGAAYGNQDSTLIVDLPGSRNLPRCYFIADGREDPYGKSKIETGTARHPKSVHLQPFWAGAQRGCDALGLAVLRAQDILKPGVSRVRSHFVFRRPDAIWLGANRLKMSRGTVEAPENVQIQEPLVLRYGTAAIGIQVPWFQSWGPDKDGPYMVDDGNESNCLRLTIDHGWDNDLPKGRDRGKVGAAFYWIRVGSGLKTDADFNAWRNEFNSADIHSTELTDRRLAFELKCKDGPLALSADAPFDTSSRLQLAPPPYQGVLEVNGKEIGRPLLTAVEPLSSSPPNEGPLANISVPPGKPVYWNATDGLVLPGMTICEDAAARGHRYVVQEATAIGEPSGILLWTLNVEKAGRYRLWAHVRSTDPKQGKFEIRVAGEDGAMMPAGDWVLRSADGWQWKPLEIAGRPSPLLLDLPKGLVRISLQARQSGSRIDRLMLTDDAQLRP